MRADLHSGAQFALRATKLRLTGRGKRNEMLPAFSDELDRGFRLFALICIFMEPSGNRGIHTVKSRSRKCIKIRAYLSDLRASDSTNMREYATEFRLIEKSKETCGIQHLLV